ncbi:MAG: hypothetical protein R2794_09865 [Chitinophagales bacterium]
MFHKHTAFLPIAWGLVITLFLTASCTKGNQNPHPDISAVPDPGVQIVRLDQMLAKANGGNYREVFTQIEAEYPDAFTAYYRNFWGLAPSDSLPMDALYDSLYLNAVGNAWMRRLYDSVQLVYPDLAPVQKDLNTAFRYFKYYFPDSTLPNVFSYIGPFVYWTMIDSNSLGIELDMYMGKHFSNYGIFENNMPKYISYRCDEPFIVTNVMQTLMDGNMYSNGPEASLLDEMLREGKLLYYLDCVLPDTEDSVKMGYTAQQLQWCYDNESEIWKFLAGEDLLFSKRSDDLRRYIGEAPTSTGMPDEAPGRVAVWVGWQIVRKYMHENPEVRLEELFAEPDAMKILKSANYKPAG